MKPDETEFRRTLIGGLFESHTDKEMKSFLLAVQKAGFVPVAACCGHRPFISGRALRSMTDLLHQTTPEPFFYGWPPFVCFSGEEGKVREFFRRVLKSIVTRDMSGDWRLLGILEEVKDGRNWVLFDAGIYRAFWKFSLRRRRLRKDLRTMEGLLEGLKDIVPDRDHEEVESFQENPRPVLGVGIVLKGNPEFEENVKEQEGGRQKKKSVDDFSEKGHQVSRKSPGKTEAES